MSSFASMSSPAALLSIHASGQPNKPNFVMHFYFVWIVFLGSLKQSHALEMDSFLTIMFVNLLMSVIPISKAFNGRFEFSLLRPRLR